MIPLKIQLKNFLSYGKKLQTINFTNYKLICLSGKNGHGKSALLDAITWALWGQARKVSATSKADPGILRLGEDEVSVCFDFIFNEQTYRVKRDYSKKYGKPQLYIDFGLLDVETDHFIPLTEKTVRRTQAKIESILGLTYESFINSSFLRQGQANEFSKKSAKERKEILGTILGLNHYDKAKTYVLEKIRAMNQEKAQNEKIQERIAAELESLKDTPGKLIVLDLELQKFITEETTTHNSLKLTSSQQVYIREQRQKEELLKKNNQELSENFLKEKNKLYALVTVWKEEHKRLLKTGNSGALEKEKEKLLQEITHCHTKAQEQVKEYSDYLAAQETVRKRKEELLTPLAAQEQIYTLALERTKMGQEALAKILKESEQKQLEREVIIKNKQTEKLMLQKELSANALIHGSLELQKKFEQKRELYQRWIEQGNWINTQRKELVQKQHLSQDDTNPSCPLCEQNLSQSRKKFLQQKFSGQAVFLEHRFNRLEKSIKQLKIFLQNQHQELLLIKKFEVLLQEEQELNKEHTLYAAQISTHKKEQESSQQAYQNLLTQQVNHQKLFVTCIQEDSIIKELTEVINDFENKQKTQQNQHEQLQKLSQELQAINAHIESFKKSDEQKKLQEERKQEISLLCSTLKLMHAQQKEIQKLLEPFSLLHEQELLSTQQEQALRQELFKITQQKDELFTQKGHLQADEKKREQLIKEQQEYIKSLQIIITNVHEHTLIAQALGKDGIQALLIEEVLPEIEYEANELLSRLTENQASIQIESLKDLKKGGTRETLDINISDQNGIRPYEMFSGGEAFRIDFALRIALSKLLARRAGTSLQTLIIDEGFGSQDDEGLSRIMDALYSIQDDFEKIIIVSHLATMKDQFPVHFYIEKSAQGSSVTVIEQG